MSVLRLVDYKCTFCGLVEEDDEKTCGKYRTCPKDGYRMERVFTFPADHSGVRKSIFHGPKAKGRYKKYVESPEEGLSRYGNR